MKITKRTDECPLLAQSGHGANVRLMSAFGGKADIAIEG